MASSFEKINYALRPAKNIERKMIVEALGRLAHIAPLAEYRYVGFGSTFFSDFSLFHRRLGIRKMVSIEEEVAKQARFEFNCPFACIQMEYGHSNDVLPQLPWDDKTMLWLDYDGKLDSSVLTDIGFVIANAQPGSALVVSVNVFPDPLQRKPLSLLLERLADPKKLPSGLRDRDLTDWGLAASSWQIIDNEIQDALRARNGGKSGKSVLHYRQLFHFNYADRAKMLTTGGILYEERQRSALERCVFDDLPFTRRGSNAYHLQAPNLTLREIRHFDKKLPTLDLSSVAEFSVPEEDLALYSELYRYFPAFVDAEL